VAVVTSEDVLSRSIASNFWLPQYRNYRRTSI
jgi:malate dehydrogenase (oxaloacetate-decarboxylating)